MGFLNYASEKVTTNAAYIGSAAYENANYARDVAAAKA